MQFIGMCSYYCRFIEFYLVIAWPVHDLTKKKCNLNGVPRIVRPLRNLGLSSCCNPLSMLPDLKRPFEVHCDVSGDSFEGVLLLQEGQPISFESRCLPNIELSLGIYKKELLVVIHALESWNHYLLGTLFVIHIGHQNIRCFLTKTRLSKKKMR